MDISQLKNKANTALSIEEFKNKIDAGAIVLDTRPKEIFTEGYIPSSIFIGLEGRFEEWTLSLLPLETSIVLVTNTKQEVETIDRLIKTGFTNIEGYLQNGFNTWKNAGENIDMIIDIEPDELEMDIPHDLKLEIVDVREEEEFNEEHVTNGVNLPLTEMTDIAAIAGFEENQNLYVHCRIGYRSVIACSLFKRHGMHNVRNVLGGFDKIKETTKIKTVSSKNTSLDFNKN